ncbi:MAG: TonB family protein, partial [Acidobacteriota bacterium]|nr:TonB family protein [Acidobacteriota bacterium]
MENVINVFTWIIRLSAYAAVSIAVIAIVQFAGRRRLPARWLYALWLILLFRMVLPFGPESRLSLWNFLPQAIFEESLVSPHEIPAITLNGGETAADASNLTRGGGASKESASPSSKSYAISPLAALSIVWLAGTLVMIAVVAVNNFRLWRSVRKLRQATDQSLLELFEDCKQLMRVRTVVGLVITDQVKSPALFGCLRPRVLLPADIAGQVPREELRFIFLHELAHFKQGDIWTGWIVALLQSLHWFNPLLWWAFARMRADRELACDALALSRVQGEDGERYGGALIGLLERFHHSRRLPVVAGILENKAQLKRRLAMITGFKRSTRREIIAAAALFAVLSITLLTNPKTLLSQSDEQSTAGTPAPVRIGDNIMLASRTHMVEPVYPEAAKSSGISGTIELEVTTDEEGTVVNIDVLSGPGMLRTAAIDAVRKWRYRPTLLYGVPTPTAFFVRIAFLPDGTVDTASKPEYSQAMIITIPNDPFDTQERDIGISNLPPVLTYKNQRYFTIVSDISAPNVTIDKPRLREIANAGWPADDITYISRPSRGIGARIFINKDGDIDGIVWLSTKIPELEKELLNLQVQSPASRNGVAIPSWITIQFDAPDFA